MGNFYMESTQINYRRDETLKTVDQKLQELSQESAIDTDIAPVFKSTNTYQPGDMVYYRNKLYVFNVEHTGAWAAADVTATDVTSAMNAALAGKADYADLAGAFNSETAYTAGDLVIYNGIVYRCTNDHTGAWDADDFSATTISAELNSINSNLSSLSSALKYVKVIRCYTSSEYETKHINMHERGSGILLAGQNGLDGSIYAITVSANFAVTFTKLAGANITIDSTNSENVTIELVNWSNFIIISNAGSWAEFTPTP
jgi:hypothetical protein